MKTPLTSIKAYVELLADGDADDAGACEERCEVHAERLEHREHCDASEQLVEIQKPVADQRLRQNEQKAFFLVVPPRRVVPLMSRPVGIRNSFPVGNDLTRWLARKGWLPWYVLWCQSLDSELAISAVPDLDWLAPFTRAFRRSFLVPSFHLRSIGNRCGTFSISGNHYVRMAVLVRRIGSKVLWLRSLRAAQSRQLASLARGCLCRLNS